MICDSILDCFSDFKAGLGVGRAMLRHPRKYMFLGNFVENSGQTGRPCAAVRGLRRTGFHPACDIILPGRISNKADIRRISHSWLGVG